MTNTAGELARRTGSNMLFPGILTMILGILAMGSPLIAGVSVAVFVGVLMLVGGIARMIWAFRSDSLGQGLLKFVIGGLTLLFGLMMVGQPLLALQSLTLFLAAYFIVDGLFEIFAAVQHRPETGWALLLLGGIVSLLLGLMIWRQFPLSGAWAIGILIGVKLLFAGLQMITVGTAMRAVGDGGAALDSEEE